MISVVLFSQHSTDYGLSGNVTGNGERRKPKSVKKVVYTLAFEQAPTYKQKEVAVWIVGWLTECKECGNLPIKTLRKLINEGLLTG